MGDEKELKPLHVSKQVRPIDPITTHGGAMLPKGPRDECEFSPDSREAREEGVMTTEGITLAETMPGHEDEAKKKAAA